MPAQRTIRLKGSFGRYTEKVANAALSPGHLIEEMSTGKVRKHATAGGRCERFFAQEDALQGKTADDAYAADDVVGCVEALPGDVVAGVLKAGENVAIGDLLVSAGTGELIKSTSLSTTTLLLQVVGRAEEALNLSAGGAVATRLAVRIV